MVELRLHGSSVDTVFDLLGQNENDMTYAIGWGLSRSDMILRGFVERVAAGAELEPPVVVELQEHDPTNGGCTEIASRTNVQGGHIADRLYSWSARQFANSALTRGRA